ncbi:unnamed protein product [Caenorhabditis brenneri]
MAACSKETLTSRNNLDKTTKHNAIADARMPRQRHDFGNNDYVRNSRNSRKDTNETAEKPEGTLTTTKAGDVWQLAAANNNILKQMKKRLDLICTRYRRHINITGGSTNHYERQCNQRHTNTKTTTWFWKEGLLRNSGNLRMRPPAATAG